MGKGGGEEAMGERLRALGLVLYAASVVAVVVLGVFAASGRLEAFVLGEPFLELPPPCARGTIEVDPYSHDQPATAGCAARPRPTLHL
jgi:hypothetical protein